MSQAAVSELLANTEANTFDHQIACAPRMSRRRFLLVTRLLGLLLNTIELLETRRDFTNVLTFIFRSVVDKSKAK